MASVTVIPCPKCEQLIKVPESILGKKIKCKYCNHPFVAEDPDAAPAARKNPSKDRPAVQPSKPGGTGVKARKEEPKKEPPKKEEPKPESTYKFEDDEEEGAKPKPLGVVDEGLEIPRCPHCAKELDPPDAVICVHCGFNNVTRVKAESKKVWEPEAADWINHLGPGILAAIICIAILVIVIVSWVNMRDWMTDTFLMKDDPGPDGEKAFHVKPGAFITFIIAAGVVPFLKCGRFAIRRLIYDNKPSEKIKL